MHFGSLLKRFAKVSACLLAVPQASVCFADMPPIGYVGPVSRGGETWMPPLGYVGPVPRAAAVLEPLPVTPLVAPQKKVEATLSEAPPSPEPQRFEHTGKTLISAQEINSDSETGIVTAAGKVEIVYNDYLLHADKVSYDRNTDVMAADGHVALLTPSGEVEFADHQEITGDMKQAFAQNVGILFPDNSRMAARTTQRYDERYTVARDAAYTACNVCIENPDNPPLWRMKAKSITHDNVEHRLYYHDATVDFAGVPVLYTPYLSGPDPTVKRKQGFLPLTPGISSNIGNYIRVPYYVDISPDKDMTLSPTFSEKDKAQLNTQYRQRWANARLMLDGSFTYTDLIDDTGADKGKQWRGHLFGDFLVNLDNVWRAGANVQFSSDKSYLRRYSISTADQTASRAYVEAFDGRDYMAVNSYYFQNLRAGTDIAEPIVFPSATVSMLGEPGQTLGGRWSFDANTLVTSRNNTDLSLSRQGPDTRRLSLNLGWQRQFISDTGLEASLSGLFRTDSYWANHVIKSDGLEEYNKALFTRQFEQANAVLRYPLGRSGDGYQHLLEPIVALTAAPDVRLIAKQPIEDSFDVEFDETNLFSPNRFTGNDLIEGGSRITYGLRNALTADNGARIDIFGGESYNFTANKDFPERSGLNGHASDYVGRIDFSPAPWLNMNYGFRLAQADFSPQRQDANISFGVPAFRPSLGYIQAYQYDTSTSAFNQLQQLTLGLSSRLSKYWTFAASHTQAFEPQPGPRGSSVSLTYVDECFAFGIGASHDDTNRADISSGTSIAFHFYLKSLGGLHTDSAAGISFPAEFRQTAPE
ncbi:MAG: LPS assembly protein LptD [Alphaproteobacteria bacterium]|nr:LPS assembly protein LptD [Alphaproteobacteria bacterium]